MTDGLLWAEICNLGGILLTGLLFTHSFSNKLQHSPLWLTGIANQVIAFKKSWRSFSSIHCIWMSSPGVECLLIPLRVSMFVNR